MREYSPDEQDMAEADDQPEVNPARRSRWKVALLCLAGLGVVSVTAGWFSRETIVRNVIAGQLEPLGIPSRYTIESIGPRRQVLSNVVIGDPARPDFTAERVVVDITPRFGVPQIGSVRLVRPRLYGRYTGGKLSFGKLDPLIFTDSKEPFRLPDMKLAIEDGRGRIDSDYGAVGLKLEGAGHLQGGFKGMLAAVGPNLAMADCAARGVSVYGAVSVTANKPRFAGPVRLDGMQCGADGVRLAKSAMQLDVTASEAMNGAQGNVTLAAGALGMGDYRLAGSDGTVRFNLARGRLTARYDIKVRQIDTPAVRAPVLGLAGSLRAIDGFARIEADGEVNGSLAKLGAPVIASLDSAARGGATSLVGDIAASVRDALIRQTPGAMLTGHFIARHGRDESSLIVPRADLRAKGGASLLSLSRVQLGASAGELDHASGNFSTGGSGIPQISGRVLRRPDDTLEMNLRMAEYRAGSARLAIPRLYVVRGREGGVGISGAAELSGALPGGKVENLLLPISGNWSGRGGLAMWRGCTALRFDSLSFAQLALDKRVLSVCPPRGGAIVRTTPQGALRIAGGVSALDLAGRLGETPIRLASGPVGFAYPGNLDARNIDVLLGPAESASSFRITHLAARLGKELSGEFKGAQVLLAAVPLDLEDVSGQWRYAGGALRLTAGSLRVEDREQIAKFQPLIARDATLSLVDNRIEAQALLREPGSDREVVRTLIRHDLATGSGDADLFVDNLTFDDAVQPDTLTRLALGVIANARGMVHGTGRIAWNETEVTSTGRFSTDNFDFAAALGPVSGASTTVEFTDLLGLVTKPGQELRVRSINPGIEVNDGLFTYQLKPGYVLDVGGATWPFMGGTLRLEPTSLAMGGDDPMRYVLAVEGLDAALFLQRLEMDNLAASGIFDGRMPLIFDENGGRIEDGYLSSRLPGGNVSYVGELTYKDLSPMANFAFDALRSVDYRQMRIAMDGSLEGEIVTRVTFDGISQGAGASSNFLTRRIAKLPIRFRVNLRAPFMQLITSVRSLYDQEYIRDPRSLGIVDAEGNPVAPGSPNAPLLPELPAVRPAEPSIQRSESDNRP